MLFVFFICIRFKVNKVVGPSAEGLLSFMYKKQQNYLEINIPILLPLCSTCFSRRWKVDYVLLNKKSCDFVFYSKKMLIFAACY